MRISQTLKLLGLALLIAGLGLVVSFGPGLASATQAPPNVEDFETGDLSRFPWETGGDVPWVITPVSHGGAFAVQAGKVEDNQRSWLQISLDVSRDGELSFWLKVSSEADHDFVLFFIDGQLQGRWSGEIDWTEARFELTAGAHTLKWEYIKDGSDAVGKDTAYLDDIAFPAGALFVPLPPLPGMVLIPAGSFQMGDSFREGYSDELPVHTVTVSAFYMDKLEVTKGLWDEVAAWASANGYDIGPGDGSTDRSDGTGRAEDHPVTYVSWYEAVKWANARSEREGLTPCYYTDSSHSTVHRRGRVDVKNDWVKWSGCGYRLPTEAEWEYAARGGMEGKRYPWGNEDPVCTAGARNGARYSPCPGGTAPVGSFAPNGYGLYNMAGNVWEWAWDWYDGDYYEASPGSDPRGPASGSSRVGRGGSWSGIAPGLCVAIRLSDSPGFSRFTLGFRLVRTAP